MSARVVAVVATSPAGVDRLLADAMLEDVVDLVADTPEVTGALLAPTDGFERAAAVAWPGTPVIEIGSNATLVEQLTVVCERAESAAAVIVADVPDLPTLLIGKLFSALAGPPVLDCAVCPAAGGGLVAAAIPAGAPASWLARLGVRLDDPDALERIQAAAPRRALAVGPGWHRIRARDDVGRLDPGLEGWDATRALLS